MQGFLQDAKPVTDNLNQPAQQGGFLSDARPVNQEAVQAGQSSGFLSNATPVGQQANNLSSLPQDVREEIKVLDEKIKRSEKFDQTTGGRILGGVNKALSVTDFSSKGSITDQLKARRDRLIDQGTRGLSKAERVAEEAKGSVAEGIERGARFAQFAINPSAKLRGARTALNVGRQIAEQGLKQGASIQAGRFVEELAKGESLEQSSRQAVKSGVSGAAVAMALPLIGGAARNLGREGVSFLSQKLAPISRFVKNALTETASVISSVPKRAFQTALRKELSGESIFKGKFDSLKVFSSIGKKTQRAINWALSEKGQDVGNVKEIARKSGLKINTTPVSELADFEIAKSSAGKLTSLEPTAKVDGGTLFSVSKDKLSSLEPTDLKIIRDFKKMLNKQDLKIDQAMVIKDKINNRITFDGQTVAKPSKNAKRILKRMAAQLDELITDGVEGFPALKEANEKFSQISKIRDRLLTRLKDENVERSVKRIYKESTFIQDLFTELDEVVPDSHKFMDELDIAIARDAFDQIVPGLGSGDGLKSIASTAFRGLAVAAAGSQAGPAGMAAAGAALSPAIGGQATVRGVGALNRAAQGIGRGAQSLGGLSVPARQGLAFQASREE